jgi:hypothetical protein
MTAICGFLVLLLIEGKGWTASSVLPILKETFFTVRTEIHR